MKRIALIFATLFILVIGISCASAANLNSDSTVDEIGYGKFSAHAVDSLVNGGYGGGGSVNPYKPVGVSAVLVNGGYGGGGSVNPYKPVG